MLVAGVLAATAIVAGSGAPTVVAAADGYQSLPAPVRLVDTRPGEATIDGRFRGAGKLTAGGVLRLDVAGRADVPLGTTAVMLNVTVTQPSARGFVTVYPCDQSRPTTSAVNYAVGQTVANATIATVAADGTVCFASSAAIHLVVDAAGWFPSGAYVPLPSPRRVFDSRPGQPVADGGVGGIGRRPAGSTTEIRIAGRVGVPANATAVALNVTATNTQGPGFLTVYPCDAALPLASNLNYAPGSTVPNLVITRLDASGRVCIFTQAAADVIVDVSGTFPATGFRPLPAPRRALDTRPGQQTADGAFQGEGVQPAGATLQLPVAGRLGVPADASAVVLNVVAIQPAAAGYVSVHPRGTQRPNASNLNSAPNSVVANSVVARVGPAGEICVFSFAAQHLVVDVAGWLTGPAPPGTGGHCPSSVPTDRSARERVVVRPALHRAIGVDRVAVVACDAGGANPIQPEAVAAWANDVVAPYFAEASRGRFRTVFEVHPSRRVTTSTESQCLTAATSATSAPFTNVMVYGVNSSRGGFGGPGLIYGQLDFDVLAGPPATTRRGFYVGGGVPFQVQSTVVHELGHTIHWPHSYTVGAASEHDNPVDVMSGTPLLQFDPSRFCEVSPGLYTWCRPQHTIAFNRLAAGWVDGQQVAVHPSGRVNYTLGRPGGDGVQLVVAPNPAAPGRMLTIEARPAVGLDADLAKAGVAVHVVDQGTGPFDVSSRRRQAQAVAVPDSYAHVIAPGESLSVGGVRISVLRAQGGGYEVRVVGTYVGASIR